ncbi:MAG: GNAT family N-acetyltransferase [Theionarchaea archaeon]|nr:GNAT family N-acetyltransferase [Theionarchaea archaeon]MBU7001286.1 GNAT family N-acetyltransferase [Theionarchaea archaeon]MBU7021742.1 GNAT family N-acetyltransferase [Theionarchaea archaeon]MBU7034517.1 GNAT family N-acetyltransferase [Theionarchaea archaeon]MBU7041004.1 GNAT family N-acetyltransferase [Theionarchaea archaeon]
MHIVSAGPQHVPDIIEIWKELMDFHEKIDPGLGRGEKGHIHYQKHIERMMDSERAQVLVAVDQGEVLGYSLAILLEIPPILTYSKRGFISEIAVRSAYRRKGIGTEMVARILEWFDSQDINQIQVQVSCKNEIGYNFWKAQGFKENLYVMRKLKPE